MFESQTPGAYLYEELRKWAGLSNREAAKILLSTRPMYGGRSPRDRVDERTYLSREVVHLQPDAVNPAIFGDFSQSSQIITGRMVRKLGNGRDAYNQVVAYFSGEGAQRMAANLDAYGRDGRIYLNTVMRVKTATFRREADRAVLMVMAFIAVGCLADPRSAAGQVEQFIRQQLGSDLVTMETSAGSAHTGVTVPTSERPELLGLVRVVDGAVKPPIYALSNDAQGTVIGSIPVEGSCITDVEVDVSRQHLIIWQQEGRWWCQGLESTNGTVMISGSNKELITVEQPRSLRRGAKPAPVEIRAGDTLCLGLRTRFLVMRMRG